jgi:tRNA-Thr(GGU) m(6)t(6)A37 methyltransferase TsaA
MDITFKTIGTIHSCFKEKFGIPRQAGLVPEAPATITFHPEFANADAVRELDRFSHIWIIFLFHQAITDERPVMVRPPRLGGNRKVGVFASRSPFRPNPIGMSAVRLHRIEKTDRGPVLHIGGIDLLDQTPVLDIKPYIPYSDIISDAQGGFAPDAPEPVFSVSFAEEAEKRLQNLEKKFPDIRAIIVKMLEKDPRPAYKAAKEQADGKILGIRLFDVDVKWVVNGRDITVLSLDKPIINDRA